MSDLPDRTPTKIPPNEDERLARFTRRTVVAGAAAAVTIAAVDVPAQAQSANPQLREDMVVFVLLSAALTGVTEGKLAPGFSPVPQPPAPIDLQTINPGSDPIDIKQEYFDWVSKKRPTLFKTLLQMTRDSLSATDRVKAIIDKVQSNEDAKYLARSVVLMWYLGAWYEPNDLRKHAEAAAANLPSPGFLSFVVISSKAYTQGWVMRIAQAHPMGFSEMQFGYWHHAPNKPADFIGKAIPQGA